YEAFIDTLGFDVVAIHSSDSQESRLQGQRRAKVAKFNDIDDKSQVFLGSTIWIVTTYDTIDQIIPSRTAKKMLPQIASQSQVTATDEEIDTRPGATKEKGRSVATGLRLEKRIRTEPACQYQQGTGARKKRAADESAPDGERQVKNAKPAVLKVAGVKRPSKAKVPKASALPISAKASQPVERNEEELLAEEPKGIGLFAMRADEEHGDEEQDVKLMGMGTGMGMMGVGVGELIGYREQNQELAGRISTSSKRVATWLSDTKDGEDGDGSMEKWAARDYTKKNTRGKENVA
ncbi:hypothetical protein LTR28_006426, partial [Elasticomyces elasticus]